MTLQLGGVVFRRKDYEESGKHLINLKIMRAINKCALWKIGKPNPSRRARGLQERRVASHLPLDASGQRRKNGTQ
jgi:hypothetical protein